MGDTTHEYFEVPVPPGDGRCSDDECPCGLPGETIPRGEGYLHIPEAVVDFRRDARSVTEVDRKIERVRRESGTAMVFTPGTVAPILVCEQGARRRHLDLDVAHADAERWWRTGEVPLRATPTIGTSGSDDGAPESIPTPRTGKGRPPPPPPPPRHAAPKAPPGRLPAPGSAPSPRTGAPRNGLAIASLVLGIFWMYGVGALLAVIFGHRALKQIKASRGRQRGRGLAIAGLVLGYFGLAMVVVMIVSTAS